MLYVIVFLVCFLSSIAEAICGIGGGVIIKPVLDTFDMMSVAAVSFLSGCTVLSMTTYSVVKSKMSGESLIEQKTGFPLAVGAALGGGPINLVVLFFFFSMSTKTATENSLYIIFFSQITSLISSVAAGNVPEFEISMLLLMAAGGIGGGIAGRVINKKMSDRLVNRLFIALMIAILFINLYNIYNFTR